ncbi:hypothetical protein [Nonomuraea dietziae]|uniref:hypothetical protein n=1 Tax=Nonomuraea dietziae TaxID=65515 RepID=UPI0033DB1156
MTTPYVARLAPELAHIGFPEGVVTAANINAGLWYVRTYRTQYVEVEVNEQTGDVRISRLADDASDANGWPWLYCSTFSCDIPAPAIAAWALIAQHTHPDMGIERVLANTRLYSKHARQEAA